MSHFSTLLPPLLGSLTGVFVGYVLGIKRENQQKKIEKEEIKQKIKRTLSGELREIRNNIEGYQKIKNEKEREDKLYLPNIDLPTDSKESIVYTGNFSLLEDELQRKISHVYIVVNRAKEFLNRAKILKMYIDDIKFAPTKIKIELDNFNLQIGHLFEKIKELERELPSSD